MMAPPSSVSTGRPPRTEHRTLPALFARETHLLCWQGLTVTLPEDWNPRAFSGDHAKGNLRVADDENLRLEVLWEESRGSADVPRSVERFLETLEKDARKKQHKFQLVAEPRLVNADIKGKKQLTNFGWLGERGDPSANQGWGVAWECPHCSRIVVAHVLGRGHEKRDRVQQLASEVLTSLECHGSGGWETWSVFDLEVEIPEIFQLSMAKLLISRLEFDWVKPRPGGLFGWIKREERISLLRLPVANVVLENESLVDWSQRAVARHNKRYAYGKVAATTVHDHDAVQYQGRLRNLRNLIREWTLDRVLRRGTPRVKMCAWQCEESNKLFALSTDLGPSNAHVRDDVIESLQCHQ
jgi:hypothetical protein